MSYPKVKFRRSTKKDFETLRAFVQDAKYDSGRNLKWAVFSQYPQLKTQFDKNKHYKIKNEKILWQFIDKIYRDKQTAMDSALMKHDKHWVKIAPHFFSLVATLFGNRKWPRGKYIAFGTIWGMYPHFLKNKTFQIPFRHRLPQYIPVVIAHELLHFMFYDYFYARYPKYRPSKNNFFVWHVSEIFNAIIQNSPNWLKYFKQKTLAYPEHKRIITKISRTLYRRNTWDVNVLTDEIIKEVKNKKLTN